jgi:hypothetical protein
MKAKFGLAVIVAAGMSFAAERALAQFPPITDPTKGEAKCETSTGKALTKQVGAIGKCASKCITTARKTSGPYGGCFAPYADPTTNACIFDPVKGANAKAKGSITKACTDAPGKDNCPECYGASKCTTGEPFVGTTATLTGLQGPNVYCTENGGGTPSKEVAKCEDGLSKGLTKFVGAISKCYQKCNQNMLKGKIAPDSCDPPTPADGATGTCLSLARTKANAALDKACFVPPAQAPACYDGSGSRPNTAAGWTSLVESIVNGQTPQIACGSPSGAFIE